MYPLSINVWPVNRGLERSMAINFPSNVSFRKLWNWSHAFKMDGDTHMNCQMNCQKGNVCVLHVRLDNIYVQDQYAMQLMLTGVVAAILHVIERITCPWYMFFVLVLYIKKRIRFQKRWNMDISSFEVKAKCLNVLFKLVSVIFGT